MRKVKTDHINTTPPEQLKGLCKTYYVRARRAEYERDAALAKIRQLESDLATLRGYAYDMVAVFTGD